MRLKGRTTMTNSYRAILRGDTIEWIDQPPHHSDPATIRIVMVEQTSTDTGAGMADALNALAEAGGVASIAEPNMWQRQQREDRQLPGYDAAR
jgi:hypothetical protein